MRLLFLSAIILLSYNSAIAQPVADLRHKLHPVEGKSENRSQPRPRVEIGLAGGYTFPIANDNPYPTSINTKRGAMFRFSTDFLVGSKKALCFGIGLRAGVTTFKSNEVPNAFTSPYYYTGTSNHDFAIHTFGLMPSLQYRKNINDVLAFRAGMGVGPHVEIMDGSTNYGYSSEPRLNIVGELSAGFLINNVFGLGFKAVQPFRAYWSEANYGNYYLPQYYSGAYYRSASYWVTGVMIEAKVNVGGRR